MIWPKLFVAATMNLSGGRTPTNPAKPPYKANQLEKIRNELSPYANSGETSSSGQQSPQPQHNQQVIWSSIYSIFSSMEIFLVVSLHSPIFRRSNYQSSTSTYNIFSFYVFPNRRYDKAMKFDPCARRHVVSDIIVEFFDFIHCLRLK